MQIEKDCNVVLYLEADHEGVERKIEEVGGVGSKGYAKLLDEKFYASQFDVAEVYRLDCSLKQVAFNVATANASKKGALLVQMLSPAELDQKLRAVLQQRFEQYAQLINRIDSTLGRWFYRRSTRAPQPSVRIPARSAWRTSHADSSSVVFRDPDAPNPPPCSSRLAQCIAAFAKKKKNSSSSSSTRVQVTLSRLCLETNVSSWLRGRPHNFRKTSSRPGAAPRAYKKT
eukprot:7389755-Prymnesium_polylepis.1